MYTTGRAQTRSTMMPGGCLIQQHNNSKTDTKHHSLCKHQRLYNNSKTLQSLHAHTTEPQLPATCQNHELLEQTTSVPPGDCEAACTSLCSECRRTHHPAVNQLTHTTAHDQASTGQQVQWLRHHQAPPRPQLQLPVPCTPACAASSAASDTPARSTAQPCSHCTHRHAPTQG
jgi:hypothetical protein